MQELSDKPIFIVGMPRSGTSLLLALLSAHPNIAITPETQYFGIWMRMYRHLDVQKPQDFELFWKALSTGRHFLRLELDADRVYERSQNMGCSYRSIFTAILQEYSAARGKSRWGEKSPRHFAYLSTLFEWYPDAQVLFALRDPRACIASSVRAPWGNPSVYSQSIVWNESMDCYEKYKDDPRVLTVRYEDVVRDREPELQRICTFLEEEYTPKLLDHSTHSSFSDYQPSHGMWGVRHKEKYMQPISEEHVEKWKTQLSVGQIEAIESIIGEKMRQYGYSPLSNELHTRGRLRLLASKLFSGPGIAKPISQLWLLHHLWHVPTSWLLSRLKKLR
jgi:hypothetical protein